MDIDPIFIRNGLIIFIVLVVSIGLHEWGHAVVADLLGDDTPRAAGRVTLNPIAHIDPIGTVVIPLINMFVFRGSFAFIGWGKPVMINPSNFRNRKRDEVLVTLAGPASNLLLALVAIVVGSLIVVAHPRFGELVRGLVLMNVGLAVFNLLPIPPLDGGTILRHAVGMSEQTYHSIARWSGIFILIFINVGVTQRMIGAVVGVACLPYVALCHWINPSALSLIFQS
ncbi:MAG TPA: site-2 protease family protein [Opitutaceae bacterium]|nr:site-2 protease family protein [Opitutaceae bacterium]